MSATRTTIVAILVLAVTFTAGVAVGVFGAHIALLRSGYGTLPTKMMVNHLDLRLDLTDRQRAQVEEIIHRHRDAIATVRATIQPRVRIEIEQANTEIRRILTPEQRRKFERIKLRAGVHTRSIPLH
ncbi:MAG: Spy/CpxP family protein refolding chaperone [Thermoanaerobaculia bacterium]